MITIETVTIKTTRTNKEYKSLKLSDGNFVNMWGDDIDYSIAEQGADLDRDIAQEGQYWNLLPKGTVPVKNKQSFNKDELNEKLNVMYEILKQIAAKVGIEETKSDDNGIDYPEEDINPEDIPF